MGPNLLSTLLPLFSTEALSSYGSCIFLPKKAEIGPRAAKKKDECRCSSRATKEKFSSLDIMDILLAFYFFSFLSWKVASEEVFLSRPFELRPTVLFQPSKKK